MKGPDAGHAHDVLGQHVEPAGARPVAVELARVERVERSAAFQHLEAVGRHQQRPARLVEPVVGAADALRQARHALGRADLDDEIDIAPIDAEIERGGRDYRPQLARRHRRLDLAALLGGEAAVMEARSADWRRSCRHSSWNTISAWARVLTKTMVVRWRRIAS